MKQVRCCHFLTITSEQKHSALLLRDVYGGDLGLVSADETRECSKWRMNNPFPPPFLSIRSAQAWGAKREELEGDVGGRPFAL
jgi:hypothetical protein